MQSQFASCTFKLISLGFDEATRVSGPEPDDWTIKHPRVDCVMSSGLHAACRTKGCSYLAEKAVLKSPDQQVTAETLYAPIISNGQLIIWKSLAAVHDNSCSYTACQGFAADKMGPTEVEATVHQHICHIV